MDTSDTREIIVQLKAAQKEQGLSIQDIMKKVDETGRSIGETTIRRVFKPGSEDNDSFNYNTTLKPIIEALAVYGKSDAETKLLLATNEYKNRQIEELVKQIDGMRKRYEERCEEYEKRMAIYQEQINLKDQRMDRKDVMIEKLLDQVLVCGKCPVNKK